jgi:pterin-4a-carbinolamine dehydratase
MMSEIKKLSLLVLINMAAATSAYAARIVDTANQKAVNNVQWNKIKNIDVKQPTGVKHIITDLDSFERYVKAKQFNTAKQLREQYLKDHPDVSISYNAFVDTLHRINWTFKKRPSPTKNQTP